MVERFSQGVLRDVMYKAVRQDHHSNWSHAHRSELLYAVVTLAHLTVACLQAYAEWDAERWDSGKGDLPTTTLDLAATYAELLSWVWDDDFSFAKAFRDAHVPDDAAPLVRELATLTPEPQPGWARLVELKFESLGGFQLLARVRTLLHCSACNVTTCRLAQAHAVCSVLFRTSSIDRAAHQPALVSVQRQSPRSICARARAGDKAAPV